MKTMFRICVGNGLFKLQTITKASTQHVREVEEWTNSVRPILTMWVFMLYRHIFLMGVRTCKLMEDFVRCKEVV
jgi:hypothetical protein